MASNWTNAVSRLVMCPFCKDDRQTEDVERRGTQWFCNSCGRAWEALTVEDQQLLKVARITPEG